MSCNTFDIPKILCVNYGEFAIIKNQVSLSSFKIYIVMEFQRLKTEEKQLFGWSAKHELGERRIIILYSQLEIGKVHDLLRIFSEVMDRMMCAKRRVISQGMSAHLH